MHYAYQSSGDDLTRRLLLLQNAAFLTLFRGALGGRGGKVREARIDQLEPAETPKEKDRAEAIEAIFASGGDKTAAAKRRWPTSRPGTRPSR